MGKRTPTERTARIRAARGESELTADRCPVHGHKVHLATAYGDPIRFVCGCKTGRYRN